MLQDFLFFSKKQGKELEEKILEKLDKIVSEQTKINKRMDMLHKKVDIYLDKIIVEQEKINREINKSSEKLMNYQTKESQNLYGILNQLLLKDLLEEYNGSLEDLIKKYKSK